MSKNGKQPYPVALTANGEPFSHTKTYFFFDDATEEVRPTTGLRRVDAENLGSLGYRVIQIAKLHLSKDAALDDGQKYFLQEIERLRAAVRTFESAKTPKNRGLKMVLMSS